MRNRALLLPLLALLVAACGAHITIRAPVRIRFGRASATPTLAVIVVLPSTAAAEPTRVPPTATSSSSPTLAPSATATTAPTEIGTPTATHAETPASPPEATATPGDVSNARTPSPADGQRTLTPSPSRTPPTTPVATPPPRLPSSAGTYRVRFHQLRFSVHGEFVQIVNRGPDQDLSGWQLASAGANQAFTFPNGYVLRQGKTITVHSGSEDAPGEPGHLLWTTERMWEETLTEALLYDAKGELVDRWPRQ